MSRNRRYPPEVRERAVALVLEHQGEHRSHWAAMQSIAAKFGMAAEAFRSWVRQAERDRRARSRALTPRSAGARLSRGRRQAHGRARGRRRELRLKVEPRRKPELGFNGQPAPQASAFLTGRGRSEKRSPLILALGSGHAVERRNDGFEFDKVTVDLIDHDVGAPSAVAVALVRDSIAALIDAP